MHLSVKIGPLKNITSIIIIMVPPKQHPNNTQTRSVCQNSAPTMPKVDRVVRFCEGAIFSFKMG